MIGAIKRWVQIPLVRKLVAEAVTAAAAVLARAGLRRLRRWQRGRSGHARNAGDGCERNGA